MTFRQDKFRVIAQLEFSGCYKITLVLSAICPTLTVNHRKFCVKKNFWIVLLPDSWAKW